MKAIYWKNWASRDRGVGMKRLIAITMVLALMLVGCAPQFDKDEVVEDNTEKDSKKESSIIPEYQISDNYYQTMLPYQISSSRGLVVSNINTRLDLEEFETGLMRLSHDPFPTEEYIFREGQLLDSKTIKSWLNRKYTKEQLKENKLTAEDNVGLNPLDDGKGDIEERYEKNPEYLAHILEHDYLIKTDDNKVELGGISIGLALNSVFYYQKEKYGETYEIKIDEDKLLEEGQKIAAEVVKRIRTMEGGETVPIMVALFEQGSKDAVVPGNFISYTKVGEKSNKISKWTNVQEEYYLFPSNKATKDFRDDATTFANFKQDVEEYFPNFNGVIGKAFYVNKELQKLTISIDMQFYGKTEVIGFTQYVAGLVKSSFPEYLSVETKIASSNGQESLIVKKANSKEPDVYIYNE